jgi:hypothetical protein
LVIVVIIEGVLNSQGIPAGVRNVTFIISILGSGFQVVFGGVVGLMLLVTELSCQREGDRN